MKQNKESNNSIRHSMHSRCSSGLGWIMRDHNGKSIDGGMRQFQGRFTSEES